MAANGSKFVKRWLSDPSTYPIIAIIGGATLFCAGFVTRQAFTHPDLTFSIDKRKQTVRQNQDEGHSHTQHSIRAYVQGGNPQVMGSINDYMAGKKTQQ